MNKKRIFIACADERLRIALLLLLQDEPGLVVVGFTDRLQNLLPQLEASQAEILLLEWQLTRQAMFDLLERIHDLPCLPRVIYFSGDLKEEQQIRAAGVKYVILKNAPPDELLPILNQIDLQSTNM
jgi:DNA-binding NarL/FixJ family response regulator